MGILEAAKPAVFNLGGITLRISTVADFSPHEHTILGFCVPDVPSTVRALREKGVTFNIYRHLPQDELAILAVPGGQCMSLGSATPMETS